MKTILLMAMTVDGKTARSSNHFVDWTNNADKAYFAEITKRAGVVIMGSNTYETIGPLPNRHNIVMTRNITRQSDEFNLKFTTLSPSEILENLSLMGYKESVVIGGSTINSLFLAENLINEIHLTIMPTLFGTGLPLFSKCVVTDMKLVLKCIKEIDDGAVILKYKIEEN